MNVKRIELKFCSSGKGDWLSPDGEVESCVVTETGAWIDPDSVKGLGIDSGSEDPVVVAPDGSMPVPVLPQGVRLPSPLFRTDRRILCRHSVGGERGESHIISVDAGGYLGWSAESTPAVVNHTSIRFSSAVPSECVPVGDYLLILVGKEWEYIRWHRGSKTYLSLGSRFPSPTVEFALVREAVPPYSLFPSSWPESPVSVVAADGEEDALRSKAADFLSAYGKECDNLGLFTAPFLVMAALRLADGRHIPAGPPVLMIPNSEAPTLAVEKNGESSEACAYTLRLYGRACSLYIRIHGSGNPVAEEWRNEVVALDILTTAQVDMRPSGLGTGSLRSVFASGFSQSVERAELPVAAGVSGVEIPEGNDHRHYPGYGEELEELEGGGESPASDGSRVRSFPSGALTRTEVETAICGLSEFRVICSIPSDSLEGSTLFLPVRKNSASIEDSSDSEYPDFTLLTHRRPSGMASTGGQVVSWGGDAELPPVPPLRGAVAFIGTTTSGTPDVWKLTIEVEVVREGCRYRRRLSPGGLTGIASLDCIECLSDTFPRWLFYPDNHAVGIWIEGKRGEEVMRRYLPLRPHPVLNGAYWFRGLSAEMPAAAGSFPDTPLAEDMFYPQESVACVSAGTLPYLFPSDGHVRCGCGEIRGVVAASRSLLSGQLGEFPLEVFTSEGIWAVGVSSSGGFRAVQPVSMHGCINSSAIVSIPEGVVFCTYGGVMLLDGTKVKSLDLTGENSPATGGLSDCRIWYDTVRRRLFVFTPGKRGAAVYLFDSGVWDRLVAFEGAYVAGDDEDALLIDSDRNVYSGFTHDLSDSGQITGGITDLKPGVIPEDISSPMLSPDGVAIVRPQTRWWQLTLRPLKLGTSGSRTRLRDVRPLIMNAEGIKLRLWGGMTPGKWYPVAEGESFLRSLQGSGWRVWRLQLMFKAADATLLEGIEISVRK